MNFILFSSSYHIALPPPTVTPSSQQPSPDGCGQAMVLNCTTELVDGFVTTPTVLWVGPRGSAVSIEEEANPRADPSTFQLIFSNITTANSGNYVCNVIVGNSTEASMSVNISDECE